MRFMRIYVMYVIVYTESRRENGMRENLDLVRIESRERKIRVCFGENSDWMFIHDEREMAEGKTPFLFVYGS